MTPIMRLVLAKVAKDMAEMLDAYPADPPPQTPLSEIDAMLCRQRDGVPPRCTGTHPGGKRCPWPMGHPRHADCDPGAGDTLLTDDQAHMYPE